MRQELIETFEEELADAANNLEIEEDGDDQEALRLMILTLQQRAYERGLLDADTSHMREDFTAPVTAIAAMSSEEVTRLVTNLIKKGEVTLAIGVIDYD